MKYEIELPQSAFDLLWSEIPPKRRYCGEDADAGVTGFELRPYLIFRERIRLKSFYLAPPKLGDVLVVYSARGGNP